jgi:hypothetical protein
VSALESLEEWRVGTLSHYFLQKQCGIRGFDYFIRSTGPGWQTCIDAALEKVGLPGIVKRVKEKDNLIII